MGCGVGVGVKRDSTASTGRDVEQCVVTLGGSGVELQVSGVGISVLRFLAAGLGFTRGWGLTHLERNRLLGVIRLVRVQALRDEGAEFTVCVFESRGVGHGVQGSEFTGSWIGVWGSGFRAQNFPWALRDRCWGFRVQGAPGAEGRYTATWRRKFELPWRKVGLLKSPR